MVTYLSNHRSLVIAVALAALFACSSVISYGQSPAFSCVAADGGMRFVNFESATHLNYFPGSATTGPNAVSRATVGKLELSGGTTDITLTRRLRTIHPVLNSITGEVILNFLALQLEPGSEISIYNNEDGSGPADLTILPGTAASLVGTEKIYSGAVTLAFAGNTGTNPGAVNIRFNTGDETFTTCRNRTSAIWKAFINPNSHVVVDDMELYGGNHAPVCMGTFDENKNFVSSEIGFCLRSDLDVASPLYGLYFGQVAFDYRATENYNIDASADVDPDDQLKTARIIWILQNAETDALADRLDAQIAIWRTLDSPVDYDFAAATLAEQAQTEVPSLPDPAEPFLSLTRTGNSPVAPNTPVSFTLLSNEPVLTLSVTGGASISSIGNGTLAAGDILTITDVNSPVTIELTHSTTATATLTATYDQPFYWNVSNLLVYEPCDDYRDPDGIANDTTATGEPNPNFYIQPFVGLSRGDNPKPHRSATASWDASLPVTLTKFEVSLEGTHATLNWTTTSESNSDRFEVAHSRTTETWETIGTVRAGGTVQGLSNYSFPHSNLAPGTNYYRLKMIDRDGTFAYSDIKSIQLTNANLFVTMSPNPVADIMKLNFQGLEISKIEIFNTAGSSVYRSGADIRNEINVTKFTPGIYVVSFTDLSGNVISGKVAIAR